MNYTITVFGLGFVGLTTALAFAEKNYKVYGFDTNDERAAIIRSGHIPFSEPGLHEALGRHLNTNFEVTKDPTAAAAESDFIFLCVGTPNRENGEADLTYIFSAIDMFSEVLSKGKHRVVVIKSTVPPTTSAEKIIPYLESNYVAPGESFSFASSPEFLREGKCWDDMIYADRIVCGVSDSKGEDMLRSLYSRFDAPFFAVSLNTSEFIKYLSNTMLATMISFANEMSKIAEVFGDIQIKEAFKILHLDRRWADATMSAYVYPGCGFGGYCLPKDTQAMLAISKQKGFAPKILENVIQLNESMPAFMTNKIIRQTKREDRIGILGLSFKPGSDDVRDSSSAKIISLLQEKGYSHLNVYDPIANIPFDKEYKFEGLKYFDRLQSICEQSDVLVLVTAWEEFRSVPTICPEKTFIDCRYYI